ncbi:hypothetical protein ONS95_011652 [Cadophora gregata]|uniref:uncharacterized protein n=1 Tax=Cadophora gregata TaxID=51156 RepID=UPI0026DD4DDD|nr:uncharacterized protein ONS95_011652 [Cadophora gregata]KAK0120246.1 hypothetical protein ONS95_011652 [Cadophora gregata]
MPTSTEISLAFSAGDNDNDSGLSLSETVEALEKLCGKSVEEKDIEEAASAGSGGGGGFEDGREIDLDEFTALVRKLEEDGKL